MTNAIQPDHYQKNGRNFIYSIEETLGPEGFKAFCMGNWMKYNARHTQKGGEEDLKKAAQYLEWAQNGLPKLSSYEQYFKVEANKAPTKFKLNDIVYTVEKARDKYLPSTNDDIFRVDEIDYVGKVYLASSLLNRAKRTTLKIPFFDEDNWTVIEPISRVVMRD